MNSTKGERKLLIQTYIISSMKNPYFWFEFCSLHKIMAFLGDDDIFHELDVTSNNKVTNKTVKEKTKLYYQNLTFILACIGWHITIQFKEWKQLKNVKRKYDQIKMRKTTIRSIIYNVQSKRKLKAILAKNKIKNKKIS